jgi:putative FmdB family regulatory protein
LPLYPYRCTQCGHKFEKIQHFKSEPETVCPKCGGVLERPLTVPGFNFKGAGWYVNDYASKSSSSNDSSSGSSGDSSKSDSGDSSKTDSDSSKSKTETKTETKKTESKTESASASATTANTD